MKIWFMFMLTLLLSGCISDARQAEYKLYRQNNPGIVEFRLTDSGQVSEVLMDARSIENAEIYKNPMNMTGINLTLTKEGSRNFALITETNINKNLGIYINGKLIISPRIMEKIPNGKVQISGLESKQEAEKMIKLMNGQK